MKSFVVKDSKKETPSIKSFKLPSLWSFAYKKRTEVSVHRVRTFYPSKTQEIKSEGLFSNASDEKGYG